MWLDESVHTLLEYKKLLNYWEKIYDPRSPIDKVNERYLESINKRGYTEYYLDKLLYGNESEQRRFYEMDRDYPLTIKSGWNSLMLSAGLRQNTLCKIWRKK